MEFELKYPEWQKLLEEAILNFHNKTKLLEAEAIVRGRLELLVAGKESHDEQLALTDALATIRALS